MEQLKKQSDFKGYFSDPKQLVVFKFYAPWCGPCKHLSQTIEALTPEELRGVKVVEINVDDDMDDLCAEYNIRNIPVTLFMKDNMVLSKKIGDITKQDFLQTLNDTIDQ